jgi:hypothetical protein
MHGVNSVKSTVVLDPNWTVSLYDKLYGVYRRQLSTQLPSVHTGSG